MKARALQISELVRYFHGADRATGILGTKLNDLGTDLAPVKELRQTVVHYREVLEMTSSLPPLGDDVAREASEPFVPLRYWIEEALALDVPQPTTMMLATTSGEGVPVAMTADLARLEPGALLLRPLDGDADIERSMVGLFSWPGLGRQVRLAGRAEGAVGNGCEPLLVLDDRAAESADRSPAGMRLWLDTIEFWRRREDGDCDGETLASFEQVEGEWCPGISPFALG